LNVGGGGGEGGLVSLATLLKAFQVKKRKFFTFRSISDFISKDLLL
jgi:hypothetical protein